jgi:hypothetical protein
LKASSSVGKMLLLIRQALVLFKPFFSYDNLQKGKLRTSIIIRVLIEKWPYGIITVSCHLHVLDIMSMQHSCMCFTEPWSITITSDNILDLHTSCFGIRKRSEKGSCMSDFTHCL